jgi:hypothetical protein
MNTGYCIMPNGERLRFERWAYEAWTRRNTTDPLLISMFSRAVHIVINW